MRRWAGCLVLLVLEVTALAQFPSLPGAPALPPSEESQYRITNKMLARLPALRPLSETKLAAPHSVWEATPITPPLLGELSHCPIPPANLPYPFSPSFTPSTDTLQHALDELKSARQRLENERKQANPTDQGSFDQTGRLLLRVRLADLLRRFDERNRRPQSPSPALQPVPPGPVTPPVTEPAATASDPLTLGEAQYRAEQYETALQTLKRVRRDDLTRQDQAWVQYLSAGCLKHMNKLGEAAVIYREITVAREDPFLTEMAIWHLGFLAWREQTEAAIEKLRRETPRGQP